MCIRVYDRNPFDDRSRYIDIYEEDLDVALELIQTFINYGLWVLTWEKKE